MNAFSPHPSDAADGTAGSSLPPLAVRWRALEEAGQVVASLAGLPCAATPAADDTRLLRALEGPPRELVDDGVGDLAAVMEAGIAALLSVCARGGDPAPAASALYREFAEAHSALGSLLLAPSRRRA